MGVDLDVVLAATVTAEEAFALPERLNHAPAVVAACRAYDARRRDHEPRTWAWTWTWTWGDQARRPLITSPAKIVEAWDSPHTGTVWLSGSLVLSITRARIKFSPGDRLAAFASDHEGCQLPVRQLARALVRELGGDRVLYLPDSGDCPSEVGDLYDVPFADALARLTAWGPPVSELGVLAYGRAVRNGYLYGDGALRRPDGTPLTEAEIIPGGNHILSGGIARYHDGTLVPAEELARPDLRGGFAYFVDDFHDLASSLPATVE